MLCQEFKEFKKTMCVHVPSQILETFSDKIHVNIVNFGTQVAELTHQSQYERVPVFGPGLGFAAQIC